MNAQTKIEAPKTILGALAAALPELEGAKKNKANPAFKSKYADLGAVIEAIQPIAQYGLWFRQVSHERDDGVCVETFYIHESGELSAGKVFVPADKKNAQGYGSANSYARRYALQTAFGLATEDDDGNAASAPAKAAPAKPASTGPVITDDQLAQLEQLIPAARLTPAQFNQTMEIARTCDLPADRFDEAVERLQTRLAELAKKATAAKAKEAVNA